MKNSNTKHKKLDKPGSRCTTIATTTLSDVFKEHSQTHRPRYQTGQQRNPFSDNTH